jgi:acetyltransferase-like isoleucine patch superfamily enzyme
LLLINNPSKYAEPFPGMIEIHKNSSIVAHAELYVISGCHITIVKGANLILGSGFINRHCNIKCYERIEIGKNVIISENVTMWDSDVHKINNTQKITSPIKIKNNVWIGANVTILKGGTIGEGAVIAAGTIVNKDVKSNSLVGGIPAKILKENITWEK